MTVLVTGGCGLVGSFAVREALRQGARVIAFDRAIKMELLDDVAAQVTFVQGDILRPVDLVAALREHDVRRVLHTASFLTPGAYAQPYASAETTLMGTLNILEAARVLDIERVCYVSTGKTAWTGTAFAQAVPTGNLDIDADPYTSAKVGAELLCNDYAKKYGMHIPILRLGGQVFGPGIAFTGAIGQGLKDLLEKPLRGEAVRLDAPILPFSAPVMPMLYAADAGRGCMQATLADHLEHQVFNIMPQEACTLAEVVELIRELLPQAQIEVPASDLKGGPVEIDARAEAEFGYAPRYDARRGLQEYLAFLREGRYSELAA